MAFVLTREQLLADLHQAYLDARRHKRQKAYQLRFESAAKAELEALCDELCRFIMYPSISLFNR